MSGLTSWRDSWLGLAATGLRGVNVTIPHKIAVLALCAELSEAAVRAGSVNTLLAEPSGVRGDSTDGVGLLWALGPRDPGCGIDSRSRRGRAGGGGRTRRRRLERGGQRSPRRRRGRDRFWRRAVAGAQPAGAGGQRDAGRPGRRPRQPAGRCRAAGRGNHRDRPRLPRRRPADGPVRGRGGCRSHGGVWPRRARRSGHLCVRALHRPAGRRSMRCGLRPGPEPRFRSAPRPADSLGHGNVPARRDVRICARMAAGAGDPALSEARRHLAFGASPVDRVHRHRGAVRRARAARSASTPSWLRRSC